MLTTFWSLVIKITWVFYRLDRFVVFLLIPVSTNFCYETFCNKLFRFERICLEYPHRNPHNFSTKRWNTFKIVVLESNRRDLSIDTSNYKFGSEVAKIEENGLREYVAYGKIAVYICTAYTASPNVYRTAWLMWHVQNRIVRRDILRFICGNLNSWSSFCDAFAVGLSVMFGLICRSLPFSGLFHSH